MRTIVAAALVASPLMEPGIAAAQAPTGTPLDAVVEWLEPLVLEETPETMSSYPRLALDPRGGFLVTDAQAGQVRVHDSDGALSIFFGREGDGPGEFRRLSGVARLPTGELATVDFSGRLALWTAAGRLMDDRRLPLLGAMGLATVDDSVVAVVTSPVAARSDSIRVPWVRRVNVRTFEVGPEILSFPLTPANLSSASSVAGDVSPTLGHTFGLTWSIFDSLWVIDLERPERRHVVHLESRTLGINTRPVDRFTDRDGFVEWMLAATFPSAAFPSPSGGWLISLYRRQAGVEPTYVLLRVAEDGRQIWELEGTPRLVATDPTAGILYFAESTGLEPNRFERARLRD